MSKKVIDKENMGTLVYLPIGELYPHPDNPRKDLGDLSELAESIRVKGIMQNLTVVKGHSLTDDEWRKLSAEYDKNPTEELRVKMNNRKSEDGYTIIIGHRRHGGAKIAGLTELPCVVVEMEPQDQIATMLLENMQRNDLTIYEQAQGFQMMLDLGDTVETIAEKSGFSQTTVRRRIKLTELDQGKLKKAANRQLSLGDLDKLNQITDADARNKLLDEIGTVNFQQAFKRALSEQEKKIACDAWKKALEKAGLIEIEYSKCHSGEYKSCERSYINCQDKPADEYERADDEMYFAISYGSVYFRRDFTEQDKANADRQAQIQEMRREIGKKIDDATRIAYELRHDFVFGISETAAKKALPVIAEMLMRKDWDGSGYSGYYMRYQKERFSPDGEYSDNTPYSEVAEIVQGKPCQSMLRHAYALWNDNAELGYSDYNNAPNDNPRLNTIYELLIKLGYEMSDDEKRLQDGSHPLFDDYKNSEEE